MKRAGKKYTSSHTTIIDTAIPLLDFADTNILVDKITLGFITSIPSSRNANKRIKCTQEVACLLVKIRGNRAIQEFRFFTNNIPLFERDLKKYAKKVGFDVS